MRRRKKKLLKEYHDADYNDHEPPTTCDNYFPVFCEVNGSWCCKKEEDGNGLSCIRTCGWMVGLHLTHHAMDLTSQTHTGWKEATKDHAGWCEWEYSDAWFITGLSCLWFTVIAWLLMTWIACTSDDCFEKGFIFLVVA